MKRGDKWSALVGPCASGALLVSLALACEFAAAQVPAPAKAASASAGASANTSSAPPIYRCRSAAGKTTFSDSPCPAGQDARTIQVEPNVIDASGSRAATSRTGGPVPARTDEAEPAPAPAPPASGTKSIDPARCAAAESAYRNAAATAGTSNEQLDATAAAAHEACGTSFPRPRVIRR